MSLNTSQIAGLFLLIMAVRAFTLSDAGAQELKSIRDTLPAAIKEDIRSRQKTLSERILSERDISIMATPTGEADFVRLIQTLPGVASGSDGSTTYYVRGGNLGGNLQTLDGVPIYGCSHLIGLTTTYPADIVSDAEFQVGGFTSEEGNLSSSHIKLHSKDGSFDRFSAKTQISNFLLGGSISTPLKKDKLSLLASARFSPAQYEYNAISGLIDSPALTIREAGALIYDLYAKLKYRTSPHGDLSLSVFHSMDSYDFLMPDESRDKMAWTNLIAILNYEARWNGKNTLVTSVSFNQFTSHQGMIKTLGETRNDLLIRSSIDELTLQSCGISQIRQNTRLQYGLKGRYARFNPGSARMLETTGLLPKTSSPLTDNTSTHFIGTLHGQCEIGETTRHLLRTAARLNYHNHRVTPEFSILARMRLLPILGVELTGDYLTQYWHTLEGTPLGWSLDMIVPSSDALLPEHTRQAYGGLYADSGKHHFSAGCYYKDMHGLTYYADATRIFDAAAAGWADNINIGSGISRGIELMYEKTGQVLKGRFTYTWSKTDRLFPDLNEGLPFPAKYDRRHILNATASVRVLSNDRLDLTLGSLFTWQSGHWETVTAGSWIDNNFINGPIELSFYTSLNNYEMPPYIRCDLSAEFAFKGGKHPQTLNLGCYNILNRHNPFSLSYDTATGQWQQVSLLPIMPSLKYSVSF